MRHVLFSDTDACTRDNAVAEKLTKVAILCRRDHVASTRSLENRSDRDEFTCDKSLYLRSSRFCPTNTGVGKINATCDFEVGCILARSICSQEQAVSQHSERLDQRGWQRLKADNLGSQMTPGSGPEAFTTLSSELILF